MLAWGGSSGITYVALTCTYEELAILYLCKLRATSGGQVNVNRASSLSGPPITKTNIEWHALSLVVLLQCEMFQEDTLYAHNTNGSMTI